MSNNLFAMRKDASCSFLCENKGLKIHNLSFITDDLMMVISFFIPSYFEGNATLGIVLLLAKKQKNTVCQGRAKPVYFNLDKLYSFCYCPYAKQKGMHPLRHIPLLSATLAWQLP